MATGAGKKRISGPSRQAQHPDSLLNSLVEMKGLERSPPSVANAIKSTTNSGLDTSPQQFQVELILIIAFQSVSVQKNLNIF